MFVCMCVYVWVSCEMGMRMVFRGKLRVLCFYFVNTKTTRKLALAFCSSRFVRAPQDTTYFI